MPRKIFKIFLNAIPVVVILGLVPFVSNDYVLAVVAVLVVAVSFVIRREPWDFVALALGFVLMPIFEYFFVATGVFSFNRTSLFGILPIWLPILWGYGFVTIKRSAKILGQDD